MTPTPISSLDQREKKYIHELDVHHVQKVELKRFLAQEAEMSLTAIRSFTNGRKENFS